MGCALESVSMCVLGRMFHYCPSRCHCHPQLWLGTPADVGRTSCPRLVFINRAAESCRRDSGEQLRGCPEGILLQLEEAVPFIF